MDMNDVKDFECLPFDNCLPGRCFRPYRDDAGRALELAVRYIGLVSFVFAVAVLVMA